MGFPGVGAGPGPGLPGMGLPGAGIPPVAASAQPVPDGRSTLLAGLLGGWQTLDEASSELRVTPAYLWELIQGGYLRAWSLPGLPPGSAAGVRVRREDVLALLQPVMAVPVVPPARG